MTKGAYVRFDPGSAKLLGELLRAVAAFAVGGLTALADQHTDSARASCWGSSSDYETSNLKRAVSNDDSEFATWLRKNYWRMPQHT